MNFELTEQQQKLQELAIRFARQCLDDDMTQRDRAEHFSRVAWKQCADFGLLNMVVPEEYGGNGLGLADFIAVMEGLGYGERDQGLLFSLNAHLWTNTIPILRYGTDEQKRKYIEPLSDGTLIGANGASEPDAGSDVFSMKIHAERRGEYYVLKGTKMFVTNAPVADLFVIVNMKIRLDTCRPLVYRIGALKEKNQSSLMESAIAKVHVSESYVQSCLDAVKVFGGYEYMTEQGLERDLRDSVGSLLYSGTSEIQRNIIARCLRL